MQELLRQPQFTSSGQRGNRTTHYKLERRDENLIARKFYLSQQKQQKTPNTALPHRILSIPEVNIHPMQHWKQRLSMTFALLMLGCALGCTRADYRYSLAHSVSPTGQPVMLAAYQPWFGGAGHIDVGYSSQDRTVLERQVREASRLGISGFVVNWYGRSHPFEDRSYALMQRVAAAAPERFKLAIMYDEDSSDPARATETVLDDLAYAYQHYISRDAETSSAYLRYDGQPVIFVFPKDGQTDWDRVRQAVNQWPERPLLIYKDPDERWAPDFDGFYAWVQPGRDGWQRDGSNWGQQYLDSFYSTMTRSYPQKLAIGAAWPGFNDSRASWSRNRHMDPRCGRTLEESLQMYHRYYDSSRPLPFLMIETWNDYEEGTNVEGAQRGCKG